jgi:hypothetical protein
MLLVVKGIYPSVAGVDVNRQACLLANLGSYLPVSLGLYKIVFCQLVLTVGSGEEFVFEGE